MYSFLHEDEQDPSTFSSSKSLKVLDILTVFKEFLRAEDDFQQISSGISFKVYFTKKSVLKYTFQKKK